MLKFQQGSKYHLVKDDTVPSVLELEVPFDPYDEIIGTTSQDRPPNAPNSNPVPQATSLNDFPEGGFRAWCAVIGSFLALSMTQGSVQAFGVYQDFYTRTFLNHSTPSQISWIGSVQLFFLFALAIISGKLFDDGYFNELLASGSVLYLVSFLLLSFAKPNHFYQVFLSQGLGVGLAMGIMHAPCASLFLHYFQRRRALVAGVSTAGVAVGGIVQSIGLNHLINGKVGFAWGVRIYALIFFVLLIITNLIMRPRLPPRRQRAGKPAKPNYRAMFKDYAYLTVVLGVGLVFWGLFFPFFYIQLFAVIKGISPNLAFYSITILNGSSILGRILPSLFAHKFGYLNTFIAFQFAGTILLFAMLGAGSVGGLIIYTILFGFCSGAAFALSTTCIPLYVDDPNEYGLRVGFILFINSFLLLVSNPVAGALLDAPHYFWTKAVMLVGIVSLAGVVVMLFSRHLLVKRKCSSWKL